MIKSIINTKYTHFLSGAFSFPEEFGCLTVLVDEDNDSENQYYALSLERLISKLAKITWFLCRSRGFCFLVMNTRLLCY